MSLTEPVPCLTAVIGAVVIGRNEGKHLRASLASVRLQIATIVYIDSGSTDESVANARAMDIDVTCLAPSLGFTAARARNAGFARLRELLPSVSLVQFVDGDCELESGWIAAATQILDCENQVAVVCGRRSERHPEASPYNRLCDDEWDTPVGLAETCGGDALVRVQAFAEVGGFNPALIAGEEPELCHRLRDVGWTIRRVDHAMTRHDAAMTRFKQWWQRNRRSGYAYAEAHATRGHGNRAMRRVVLSNVLWSVPIAWPLWPLLWLRLLQRRGALYATYVTIGKLPHCHGQIDYWVRRRSLIEYK